MQSSRECLTGCSLILCNSLGQTQLLLGFPSHCAGNTLLAALTQLPQTDQCSSWWG